MIASKSLKLFINPILVNSLKVVCFTTT